MSCVERAGEHGGFFDAQADLLAVLFEDEFAVEALEGGLDGVVGEFGDVRDHTLVGTCLRVVERGWVFLCIFGEMGVCVS